MYRAPVGQRGNAYYLLKIEVRQRSRGLNERVKSIPWYEEGGHQSNVVIGHGTLLVSMERGTPQNFPASFRRGEG